MTETRVLTRVEPPNAIPADPGRPCTATLQAVATATVAAHASLGGWPLPDRRHQGAPVPRWSPPVTVLARILDNLLCAGGGPRSRDRRLRPNETPSLCRDDEVSPSPAYWSPARAHRRPGVRAEWTVAYGRRVSDATKLAPGRRS